MPGNGALRLHSGAPFWLLASGLEEIASPLNAEADVAIIGAGVTGALVADALTAEGKSVQLLDRRAPATGSTAASTGLLQYEIDRELHELIGLMDEQDAVRAYRLSAQAIDRLEGICSMLGTDCGFRRRPSLYLASSRRDKNRLDAEYAVRSRFGFDIAHWTRAEVDARYGFPSHGALRTDTAAEVDPVKLTRALLKRAMSRGAAMLSRTTVREVTTSPSGVRLVTDRGLVEAGQVVYATGYEVPAELRQDLVDLNNTFALVTEPVEHFGRWDDQCLVWETGRPYTYVRSTTDGRILCGGADIPFKSVALRERAMPVQLVRLEQSLGKLFPALALERAYAWGGTFGETADGLPYIGPSPFMPHAFFALGYGGNGITFSVTAADILADLCLGRFNADARIFRLDR
jgi:glycine/D-amino acid oxidase-like deaminating enzyme